MAVVTLAGNPNSGKTTLFNALTGSSQYVGNWPGVTVEKKEGQLRNHRDISIVDLPGIYSLSPYTLEEVVARRYLLEQQPDLIVNIVDSMNIERNLYLTLQLMETGNPIIISLNMLDLLKKSGKKINLKKLSYMLQVPVIGISALKHENLDKLTNHMLDNQENYPYPQYDERIESALTMIQATLHTEVPENEERWYAIKLFERDEDVMQALELNPAKQEEIEQTITTAEKIFSDNSDSIIVNARYDYIAKIVDMCVINNDDAKMSFSDKIDLIVTNRWLALPIFALVMWIVYYLSIQTIGTIGSDWVNDVLFGKWVPDSATYLLTIWHVAPWLKSLIIDGIIAGVGSVLGFVPQIMMLFLCLGMLEDCGYMARIAFVMDRIFHRFNLSGKSFIPMLISTGCGVPGIMATRTIEAENDRKMTIMLTTFMPCSAKLTVIALIAGTFFPHQAWVAPSAYFLGMLAVIISGIFLKKTQLFSGPTAPFIMELPAYHLPILNNIIHYVWSRSKAFVQKAGTIIFMSCVAIWFLSSFNFRLQMVSNQSDSILRYIGAILSPIFAPLGFGDWRACVAVIAGLIAKENCVDTLRIAFGSNSSAAFSRDLLATYTSVAGYCFLAFNLLCAPCFAAIGTMYKEFGDIKWTLRAVGYQTGFAYLVAMLINQWSLIFTNQFTSINVILAVLGLYIIVWGLFIKKGSIASKSKSTLA
ncbi:ferrous iron transport protein B [Ligilactobacillus sp. WILCCON 0076]|uniref:Ferrous iron transport protein B n=1 Tax=Ligilactobacillus ubinensis TaxID=2876789 RepID=A0A9X2FI81_9LACO|nr:ferrous iron transport protein B [Ligilactobacillus ubinensis]MCP0886406.1 ferrous iron transport protein B [Ligilactobacillus ubinensis]